MNEFFSQIAAGVVVVVIGYFLLRFLFSCFRRSLSRASGPYDFGNIELTPTQETS